MHFFALAWPAGRLRRNNFIPCFVNPLAGPGHLARRREGVATREWKDAGDHFGPTKRHRPCEAVLKKRWPAEALGKHRGSSAC
jgi:hypothetical protein